MLLSLLLPSYHVAGESATIDGVKQLFLYDRKHTPNIIVCFIIVSSIKTLLMTKAFEEVIRNKLEVLVQTNKISQEQLSHFLRRGIQVISPKHDFGLDSLHNILPEVEKFLP